MILANGKLYDSGRQGEVLACMEERINRTMEGKHLEADMVISALACLGQKLEQRYGYPQAAGMFSREAMEDRLMRELGNARPYGSVKPSPNSRISTRVMPLGTLLHIGAGNADFLPAYSVAEGLLTCNVNILKLPGADSGASLEMLRMLIDIQPELADYIYVFDTSSKDRDALMQLAGLADGIVVWGGDGAVTQVRSLAPPGIRLVEWGHKLGFAYISGYTDREAELAALAGHMMATKQLLCSSCQTVFIDTESYEEILEFGRGFLDYLERAADRFPGSNPIVAGAISLRHYNDELERIVYGEGTGGNRIFQGKGCSVTVCGDMELELSPMFGNCLIKRLPRNKAFGCLRRHKGHLQTAGLICAGECREELVKLLCSCGVSRITDAGSMSALFADGTHDGEYPLRRYVRFVDVEDPGTDLCNER